MSAFQSYDSDVKLPEAIYMDGCAWGCAFFLGVGRRLEKEWGVGFGQRIKMLGDSSGALIALCWAAGLDSDFCTEVYKLLAEKNGVGGMLRLGLSDAHDMAIDYVLKRVPDAAERVRGRLFVGVTRFPMEHLWISDWKDTDELRRVLHASFHIPVYCREAKLYQREPLLDGAVSMRARHLPSPDRTLVLSGGPWSTLPSQDFAEISYPTLPWHCLFPPGANVRDRLVLEGEKRAEAWLSGGANLIARKYVSPLYPVLMKGVAPSMWFLRFLERYMLPRRKAQNLSIDLPLPLAQVETAANESNSPIMYSRL